MIKRRRKKRVKQKYQKELA